MDQVLRLAARRPVIGRWNVARGALTAALILGLRPDVSAQGTTATELTAPPAEVTEANSTAPEKKLIETIVVTAQKTAEGIGEIPLSLSVLSEDFLKDQKVTDFREIALYVPNFKVSSSPHFPDTRIRGFGTARGNLIGFEQSVGLVLDGVSYGKAAYWQGALFDLDRVEVLRGPQGTIFGKNTTAGLVNIVTKKPTDELEGDLTVDLGQYGYRRIEAATGGPVLPELINFRVAILNDEQDGLVENTSASVSPRAALHDMLSRDREGVRVQLAFPNVLGGEITLGYEREEFESIAGIELAIVDPTHVGALRQFDPNADITPGNWIGSVDTPSRAKNEIETFVANGSFPLGGWILDAVASYSNLDNSASADTDASPIPYLRESQFNEVPQTLAEVRLSSPLFDGLFGLQEFAGLPLGTSEFRMGFFTLFEDIDESSGLQVEAFPFASLLAAASPGTGVFLGLVDPATGLPSASAIGSESVAFFFDQSAESFAGFSQMRWHLTEKATLQYGMRFTHEKKEAIWNNRVSEGSGALTGVVFGYNQFAEKRSRSEFSFTPEVSLMYDVYEDLIVFGRWARGIKSGGFNASTASNRSENSLEYEEEKMESWELGSRFTLPGGAALFNLGLFRQKATDLQVFTSEPGTGILTTVNVGAARVQGAEADVTYLATDWLTIYGSAGYNHSKYLEFPIGSCASDHPNTDGDGDPRCDLSGQPLFNTPKWVGSVVGTIEAPLSPMLERIWPVAGSSRPAPWIAALEFLGGLTLEYEDVHFAGDTNDPRTRQPSFIRVGSYAGVGNPEQGWSLRVIGSNLTDEDVAVIKRELPAVGRTYTAMLEPRRIIYGAFQYSF